ncbi:multiple epidermal growth factor-like domains protein 6 [Saccostrea echinata]|uniref:multiple epidermal growth factor-like domains protein 6 n=1 Tax=Saccostrea echinata TaxID=191078 RepID=UPI002A83973A|nr:multiple epidermal growth factor-like domains protein 6 [Saccostrea echinata]
MPANIGAQLLPIRNSLNLRYIACVTPFQFSNYNMEQRQRERMYGYKLYISNSTDFSLLQEAYLCYNHKGPDLPDLNVTHKCVTFGRYVIFYNERVPGVTYPNNQKETYTQLCEVIVQGCDKDDVHGNLCNKNCPSNCQEKRCYITNGTCAGCTDGWIGKKCRNACPAGKYGAECKNTCTDHCGNNTSCNHVTGHCEGCLSGWMGYDCNEIRPPGTYGEDCRGSVVETVSTTTPASTSMDIVFEVAVMDFKEFAAMNKVLSLWVV